MDKKIFRDVSYGMYVVSTLMDDKMVGCVINTFSQVNSVDPLVSISLNKENYTNEGIRKTKRFGVSIISNDTKKEIIGKFGYQTSREVNKFLDTNYELVDGLPVVMEECCGYVICEVVNIIDCNTHDIIVAKVLDSKKINDNVPMTYKYYHENLKGVSPEKAPTYVIDEVNKVGETSQYRCNLCGYIYDEAKEGIKFEDLPDDWKCPLCGAPKSSFVKI